jgi:hypothetical protein
LDGYATILLLVFRSPGSSCHTLPPHLVDDCENDVLVTNREISLSPHVLGVSENGGIRVSVVILDNSVYYIYIYICKYITLAGYIEYRIDSFGLQKHLLESEKKTLVRIKTSSEIDKNTLL